MGLQSFWKNYKVLIVMGPGLGLVHWGWFRLQATNSLLHKPKEERVPEPGIVAYVSTTASAAKSK